MFNHVFLCLIIFLKAPLNSMPKNTYILTFWSCETGGCGYSGSVCVLGEGEREQTPIVPQSCWIHINTCKATSRARTRRILCMVGYIIGIVYQKKNGGHWWSGWWDMVRVMFGWGLAEDGGRTECCSLSLAPYTQKLTPCNISRTRPPLTTNFLRAYIPSKHITIPKSRVWSALFPDLQVSMYIQQDWGSSGVYSLSHLHPIHTKPQYTHTQPSHMTKMWKYMYFWS